MNCNRYMHPRNKYKKPPDYKQLAITYPEFRKITITNIAGKVRIDFQNKESLRVLTETLLKHDFDLHVNIPPDNLNPALPLRMNYILWIEDLMKHVFNSEMDKITGIDIGTGAICIYALLLAKVYGCRVIGTEVNKTSVETAMQCIERNNLQDLIEVITVDSNRIFKDIVKESEVYHFSMCNPPFFEIDGDSSIIAKALPPRNAPTGNETELKTVGGELAFITKMIEESIELRDKIKVYTTMVGRKADLLHLKGLLKSKSIENVTWTEFCQGHTTRWGLAWSFLTKTVMDLGNAPVIRKCGRSIVQPLKRDYKTLITVPVDNKFSCMDDLISFLKATVEELNIKLQNVPNPRGSFDGWIYRVIAMEKTWEHARRKRRLAQRQMQLKESQNEDNDAGGCSGTVKGESDHVRQVDKDVLDKTPITKNEDDAKSMNEESSDKNISDKRLPLLTCEFWIELESPEIETTITQNDVFKIWMVFENGTGGLDALQSFRQYLINKLGVREKLISEQKLVKQMRKRIKKDSNESVS